MWLHTLEPATPSRRGILVLCLGVLVLIVLYWELAATAHPALPEHAPNLTVGSIDAAAVSVLAHPEGEGWWATRGAAATFEVEWPHPSINRGSLVF